MHDISGFPSVVDERADLAALAATVCKEHEATVLGLRFALEHAMAAGDALLKAKAALKEKYGHGHWLSWLKHQCNNLSERTARNYMAIAAGRTTVLEANRQRVADLSVRGALDLLKQQRQPSAGGIRTSRANPKQPTVAFGGLAWLTRAPLEERRHAFDGAGARVIAEAIPPSWEMTLARNGASVGEADCCDVLVHKARRRSRKHRSERDRFDATLLCIRETCESTVDMALPQDLESEDVTEAMDALATAKQQIDTLLQRLKSQHRPHEANLGDDGLDIPACLRRAVPPTQGSATERAPLAVEAAGADV